MTPIIAIAIMLAACGSSFAWDLRECAGRILLGSAPGQAWGFLEDGNIYAPPGEMLATADAVNAITNRADVLALAAEMDAAATAPRIEPNGIEVPVIVLQSATNDYGIGVIASDDGALLTYVDHQSPRPPPAVIQARIAEALAERRAGVESARTNRAAAIPAAAAANSIPALREAVRLLQAQVDALMALNGIDDLE
jgi:regulator of protease activity HflC (stomatin/prohibitin superfamily)